MKIILMKPQGRFIILQLGCGI